MEVHFSPDVEKKLRDLANETGRKTDELVQDTVAGFVTNGPQCVECSRADMTNSKAAA
jgi:hypothetical protein